MSDSTLTRVIHIRAGGTSFVFDLTTGKIPRVTYWGDELVAETPATLLNMVEAAVESVEGNQPDAPSEMGMIPTEADGWMGRPGLSGFRQGGTAWSPRFVLTAVDAPGQKLVGEACTVGAGQVVFSLVDERNGLDLKLIVELTEQGVFRGKARLTNTAGNLYQLQELGLTLPLPLEANQILDTSGRWGKEHVAQRRPVVLGCDLREGRHGRTGFDAPGLTMVGPEGFGFQEGEVWGFHTAFSGDYRTWVEKLPAGLQVVGGSQILHPGEVSLVEGESYTTPWFYAVFGNGMDQAANRLHRWMRARPTHISTDRPVTLNVWEAVYFVHDLDKLKALADLAAEIGVERFVLDDGWFKGRRNDYAGLGDWEADPDVWPEGLTPLAEHVSDLGMEFGVWFEPEMVNLDSDLARENPTWVMGAQGSTAEEDLPLSWRHQQVLNISIPEARKHIEDAVVKAVQDYDIDYIKWDHNRDLIEAGDLTQGGKAAVDAQTRAYYRLVDDIKERCPDLEIESCASGGGRIDLEVLQHTDRVWVSDCIDPVERQEMVRSLGQLIPPELMGTHIASPDSHTTGRTSSMSMRGATALWGHMGIEWDISSASPEELEELRAWIDYYKENREFLLNGNLVRALGPDETVWLSGVIDDAKDRALYQMVTRGRSAIAPLGRLRFPGLDPTAQYRVRPVIIGEAPSGLVGPPWFGVNVDFGHATTDREVFDVSQPIPGTILTGEALHLSGVQTPRLHADQVLLISAERV